MKLAFCMGLLFFSLIAVGQSNEIDTIRIPEVAIRPDWAVQGEKEVLDPMILQDPSNQNLADALNRQSAVYVKSYGIGSLASLSLRGAGANHSNVVWNGIVLNSTANGQVDLSLFPTIFLDEAALQGGTSSLQSASGGLGGALLLSSNSAQSGTEKLSLQQQIGSFGQQSTSLNYTQRWSKAYAKTTLWQRAAQNDFSYINRGEPGFPEEKLEQADLSQLGVKQDLYWQISENERIGMEFWYLHSDRNLPTLFTVNELVESQEDEHFRSFFTYQYFTSKSEFKIATAVLREEIGYENEVAEISNQSLAKDWKSYADYKTILPLEIKLSTRVNFDYSMAEQQAYPDDLERKALSGFAEFSKDIGSSVYLSLSARQEFIFDEKADAFLPNAKLSYAFDEQKRLVAQVQMGKNWKYPSLNDRYWVPGGNPELKPERAETIDFSVNYKGSIATNRWQLDASIMAYRSKIENYIQWQPTTLGYWQANNIGSVLNQGLQHSLKLANEKAQLKKRFVFSYAYTQAQGQTKNSRYDESKGKQLIYIPEHKYAATAILEQKGYFMNVNLQFMGARYTTSDNVEFLPYYLLSDFEIGKKLIWSKHTLKLSFAVLNLGDEEYQAIEWRPMPGRNYLVNLKYTLHEK